MVYVTIEDCKSELGKRMYQWRSERPDEWIMDEFIRGVEEMDEKIRTLEFMVENGLGYEDLRREI